MNKKNLSKVIATIATTVFLGAAFTGCGSTAKENSEGSNKTDLKIAWYASAPHPYFEDVKKGVEGFQKETGITVTEQIGPDWKQESESQNIEALAAKGIKYFAIYPSDPASANGLIDELDSKGINVINFGASTTEPTKAKFYVGTDVKQAAMDAAEKLISLMGDKGNIINVLEVLEDANTKLRKEGVEEAVKKHPNVKIIQEISGMKSNEEAVQKIQDSVAANIDKVDGIIATGDTTSVGIAQVMADIKKKGNTRTIHTIGIDTDPIVIKAIQDGYMDATVSQNPYGHGYLSCTLLKYLSAGWKPKAGQYRVDTGTVIVTKANATNYQDELTKKTAEIKANLETKYLEKK
ncbi:sugar ABC transporter substrate-binding protein [Clostridium thailandense]|uniref:sugar ABC transporter substrate-binding protein n=1 Tax=Clostridium thailandense TaxID=2794346 RepID=UPI00398907D0